MSSTLTNLTAATTWSGTDLFYALVGGNSRKIAAAKFLVAETSSSLAMQDSTTAQTFRVYRTFTNSSNYERLALTSSSGLFEIKAETAGTGDDDLSLHLTPSGRGDFVVNLSFTGTSVGIFKTICNTSWTNITISVQQHFLRSTGTVASGFGFGMSYNMESASGSDVECGRTAYEWLDATGGSEELANASLFSESRCVSGNVPNRIKLWRGNNYFEYLRL